MSCFFPNKRTAIVLCLLLSNIPRIAHAENKKVIWGGAVGVYCGGITNARSPRSVFTSSEKLIQLPKSTNVNELGQAISAMESEAANEAELSLWKKCGRACRKVTCSASTIGFGEPQMCRPNEMVTPALPTRLGMSLVLHSADGFQRVRRRVQKFNLFGAGVAFQIADSPNQSNNYILARGQAWKNLLAQGAANGVDSTLIRKYFREYSKSPVFSLETFDCAKPILPCAIAPGREPGPAGQNEEGTCAD